MRKRDTCADLPALRERLRRIAPMAVAARGGDGAAVAVGVPAIDGALPWGGLPRAALHQVSAPGRRDAGAATGFTALLAARLAAGRGPVLWCLRGHDLYGPGLAAFGLPPARLLLLSAADAAMALAGMEEGLRAGALGAVVAEVAQLDLTASRRLQLAAEAGDTPALILALGGRKAPAAAAVPTVAVTAWRVTPAPAAPAAGGLGEARWRVDLERCRGGIGGDWLVEWRDATGDLALVEPLADGSRQPGAGRRAEG